jgi:hypothetical protein
MQSRMWTVDSGQWTVDSGQWTVDYLIKCVFTSKVRKNNFKYRSRLNNHFKTKLILEVKTRKVLALN